MIMCSLFLPTLRDFLNLRTKLGEYMVEAVNDSISGVEECLFVVDATDKELNAAEKELINKFRSAKMPVITALNKIDMISRKEELISKIAALSEQYGLDSAETTNLLYNGGLRIYATVDPEVQSVMENVWLEGKYWEPMPIEITTTPTTRTIPRAPSPRRRPASSSIIRGELVGVAGALAETETAASTAAPG